MKRPKAAGHRRAAPKRKRSKPSRPTKQPRQRAIAATPVTSAELRALRKELEQRLATTRRSRTAHGRAAKAPMRWNPDPEDVQKSVAQLVLTIVEFLRQLMERQAIRRMEQGTLTKAEVEAVGSALMQLEKTIREIGRRFGLSPEELNLDLGALKLI